LTSAINWRPLAVQIPRPTVSSAYSARVVDVHAHASPIAGGAAGKNRPWSEAYSPVRCCAIYAWCNLDGWKSIDSRRPTRPSYRQGLSNLLRFSCADYRQTSDRGCAKEACELERLSWFLGQDRGRGRAALEQLARCQANAQRCGLGWRLRSVRYQEQRSQVDILHKLRDGNGYGVGGVDS